MIALYGDQKGSNRHQRELKEEGKKIGGGGGCSNYKDFNCHLIVTNKLGHHQWIRFIFYHHLGINSQMVIKLFLDCSMAIDFPKDF